MEIAFDIEIDESDLNEAEMIRTKMDDFAGTYALRCIFILFFRLLTLVEVIKVISVVIG